MICLSKVYFLSTCTKFSHECLCHLWSNSPILMLRLLSLFTTTSASVCICPIFSFISCVMCCYFSAHAVCWFHVVDVFRIRFWRALLGVRRMCSSHDSFRDYFWSLEAWKKRLLFLLSYVWLMQKRVRLITCHFRRNISNCNWADASLIVILRTLDGWSFFRSENFMATCRRNTIKLTFRFESRVLKLFYYIPNNPYVSTYKLREYIMTREEWMEISSSTFMAQNNRNCKKFA